MEVTQEIAMMVGVSQSHSGEMLKRPEKANACSDTMQW